MSENQYRQVKTVGHPIRIRRLEVKRTELIAPQLKRIVLGGDELENFISLSPDDHIKMFFPHPGESEIVVPSPGPNGITVPEGKAMPPMRDYTPVAYNAQRKELELIFFLHENGIATEWAKKADEGSPAVVAGPRGSRIVPHEFDSYLMIGDESAIPSFTRRLREFPVNSKGLVILEINRPADRIEFQKPSGIEIVWLERNGAKAGDPTKLHQFLKEAKLPPGDFFTWVIGESMSVKGTAELLLQISAARKEWMKVSGYWDLA